MEHQLFQLIVILILLALFVKLLLGIAKGIIKFTIFVLMFAVPLYAFSSYPVMATVFLVCMLALFFMRKRIYRKVFWGFRWRRNDTAPAAESLAIGTSEAGTQSNSDHREGDQTNLSNSVR